MVGMTTVTGTQGFSRIIPLPSAELQSLPPAAPLQPSGDPKRTTGTADRSELQADQVARQAPIPQRSADYAGTALREVPPAEVQVAASEAPAQAAPDGEELGSNLDVFV